LKRPLVCSTLVIYSSDSGPLRVFRLPNRGIQDARDY
jgi:hypothetical protein